VVDRDRLHGSNQGALIVKAKLSSGTYGDVYKCVAEDAGVTFALKRVTGKPTTIEGELIAIAHCIQHANIVVIHECFHTPEKSLCLRMHFYEGPELWELCGSLPSAQNAAVSSGLLRGLAHLHRLDFVHRDCKPENVVLHARNGKSQERTPVLVDLGTLRLNGSSCAAAGTYEYMPPEVCHIPRGHTHVVIPSIDAWSLGVTLYATVVGDVSADARVARLRQTGRDEQDCRVLQLVCLLLNPDACERPVLNTVREP
jgi:serine/threonine protein kinase